MGATRLHKLKRDAEEDPENLDKWYSLGKYAADRFIVGVSEEALVKVVKERPHDPEVLALLGKALNRRRKLAEAEKIYKKALEMDSENAELLTGLAVVYGNLGEMNKSIEYYQRSLAIDPGYPWTVHAYKHTLESVGKPDEIESMLRKALDANPESALVSLSYAVYLRENGKASESQKYVDAGLKALEHADPEEQSRAVRILQDISQDVMKEYGTRLLEKDPDNVDILISVCIAEGDSEAVNRLKDALDNDPRNMRIVPALMALFLKTGNMAGVMEMKAKIEAESPEDALMELVDMTLSRGDIGGLLTSEEKRAKYVESTRKVLQRFPGSLFLNLQHIRALLADNRRDEAQEHVKKVIENLPTKDIGLLLSFGLVLKQNYMIEEANTVFSKASERANTPLELLYVNLVEHVEVEHYTKIMDLIESYLEREEGTPQLYAILGRAQCYAGNQEAKRTLQIAADSRQYDSMILLASMLQKDQDTIQSTKLLQEVLNAEDAKSLDKARSLLGLGKDSEAIETLERFLEDNPLELLGWQILILARQKEGEAAVKTTAKRMFEAGNLERDPNNPEISLQSIQFDELAKAYAGEVMSGAAAGKIKHQLMVRLVHSLMKGDSEEEA